MIPHGSPPPNYTTPNAVSYNQFHPKTLESWAKKLFLPSTYIALLKKWAKKQKIRKDRSKAKRRPGRPSTPQYVVDNILATSSTTGEGTYFAQSPRTTPLPSGWRNRSGRLFRMTLHLKQS